MYVAKGELKGRTVHGIFVLPTDSTSIFVVDSCYKKRKGVRSFRKKGVVLLSDFNFSVGISVQKDAVIGMFEENTCNASRNLLLLFLNEVKLMICNGRKSLSEPE